MSISTGSVPKNKPGGCPCLGYLSLWLMALAAGQAEPMLEVALSQA